MWNLSPSGFTSSSSLTHSHHSADDDRRHRPIIKSLKVLSDHGISAHLLGPSDYFNVVVTDSEEFISKCLKVLPDHGNPAPPHSSSDYPDVVKYSDLDSIHNPALAISEIPTGVFEP